jgi:aminopeptidase N
VPSIISETAKRIHRSILKTLHGRTDESSLILRGTVASRLALFEPEYAARLAHDFKDYAKVAPDMRLAVATGYARSTNDLEGLTRIYRESSSNEDKANFLDAMTAFTDEALVKRALDFAINGEVKRQDVIRVVIRATDNPQARDIAWSWLQSNIGKLQEIYQSTGILSGAFLAILPVLCIGKVQDAEDFFANHMIPDAEMGIKAGLEKLHAYDRLARTITSQPF